MSASPELPGPDDPRRPSRRRGRSVLVAATVLFTAGLAALVLPDLVGRLDRYTPLAQAVSFRPYTLVALAGLLVVAAMLARRRRWMRPFLAGGLVVLIVGIGMVVPRMVPGPSPAGPTLTVAALNTFDGQADVAEVAAMISSERPDLVSLLEAGETYRARLAPLVEPLGYQLITSTGSRHEDLHGVTAIVSHRLRQVRTDIDTATTFDSVRVSGGALGDLQFIAYHSVAPRRGDVPKWLADLRRIPQWCASPDPAIVAGDFNATLDHSALREATRGCSDAAARSGMGVIPTWPTWAPSWLGTQIDHVFATDGIVAADCTVREISGTDHRAVIARLQVPPEHGA